MGNTTGFGRLVFGKKQQARKQTRRRKSGGRTRIEHQIINGTEKKNCSVCCSWKPLDQFSRNITRWDGLASACRDCQKDEL